MKSTLHEKKIKYVNLISQNFDYFFIFLLYFFPHLFMNFNRWDDIQYTAYLEEYDYNLLGFVFRQYRYWTSRVVIEAAVVLFGWLPPIIWVIVDTLMIVLLYYSMSGIIRLLLQRQEMDRKYRLCQMFLFLSFPYALMATAGWLTTTINWTWMLASFAYSMKILLCAVNGKNKSGNVIKNIFFCIACIYATNFDVAAVVMVGILVIVGFTCFKLSSYRFCVEYWEGVVITAANLVLFLVCPGNRVRIERDAVLHDTADVLALPFWGKIRMGINSTFYHYMSIPNAVLFTACVIILILVLNYNKKILTRVIAFVPIGITIIWTIYIFFAYTVKNCTLTYVYPDASFNICPKTEQYLALISALILVASIIYLLRQTISEIGVFVPLCIAFLVWGLLPDIVLGFTSTISASILRVVSFLYLAFILISCTIIEYSGMLKRRMILYGIIFLGIAGTILNFAQMIRHIIVYG